MKFQYTFLIIMFSAGILFAQEESTNLAAAEAEFYQISPLPMPDGVALEVGGLATLPDGSLATSTRRGEVYIIENPDMRDGKPPHFRRFAMGELTRLLDHIGDGQADQYETVTQWPLSGHYHE